ncbi:hypothetical protein BHE90_011496 [Fusarium euwallaceae]|uniref:Uncharacterized protein n=2 Tax=Fusarium solani species complex TaxID=232080 RepID=A0A3M2SCL6_9HYPO|nr:hypothetical protein CDV36_005048 [Fusarium kuroshium]RTE74083.1 hypothetical protein BHE90_011496 [Fusarium euwallaceae]
MTAPSQPVNRGHEKDEGQVDPVLLSSPLSTPLTTSPEPVSFQSLADQNSTPLSMLDDSCFLDTEKSNMNSFGTMVADAGAASAGGDKPTASSDQLSTGPSARDLDPSIQSQRTADLGTAVSAAGDGNAETTRAVDDTVNASRQVDSNPSTKQCARDGGSTQGPLEQDRQDTDSQVLQDQQRRPSRQKLISPATINTTNLPAQNSSAPSSGISPLRGPHQNKQHRMDIWDRNQHRYETDPAPTGSVPAQAPALPASGIVTAPAPAPASAHCTDSAASIAAPRCATQDMPASTSPTAKSASPGHRPGYQDGHLNGHSSHDTHDHGSSPSYTSSPSPLRVGSVQPTTKFVQPRPRTIVRTTSDSGSLDLKHPTPDITSQARSGAYVGNIAQLEATAVRLSMTSSIDDAIRDLHTELKRSDSRRSSILAASVKASGSVDDYTPGSAVEQLRRHPSIASSIVSTNNAARYGGYSPAGYVLSPNHSLTGRLRSGSKNSAGRPDFDLDSVLSRHGPGKASVRSVRSTKISLAEISESEPISLTQDVLDMADKSPPIKNTESDSLLPDELRDANMPATDVFNKMMGDDDFLDDKNEKKPADATTGLLSDQEESRDPQRPGSSRSDTTFQQCQDAFGDFDGVHWVPEQDDPYAPPEGPESPPKRQMPSAGMARPQSYMDPETGQQMLYYPARVPAMLNLPPKLSNKPKATDRNKRRSQVMSAMFEGNRQSRVLDDNRRSQVLDNHDTTRDSWLPDPLAGHRESFAALSTEQLQHVDQEPQSKTIRSVHSDRDEAPAVQPETAPEAEAEPLRRPRRLSKMDPDKRKSRMSNLPPQLRASVYFDIPPTAQQDIEVKDGSAMATLDSILDASANAPVNAFTDHERAGKLGQEVYGKERKRASIAPSMVLRPESGEKQHEKHARKRSSFMWLKRHSHASDDDDHRASKSDSGLGPVNADTRATENEALARSVDGRSDGHSDDGQPAKEGEGEESEEEAYYGPPTTLLAELQLRKQQQKQRTQRTFPGGMHATLLEIDAVAETQRKARKNKRVNLAWEDADGNLVDEDSDDEDVPLAIIAARNQGAQNVMDLNRPLGLMERREMEDNEPLSQRRARLHGQDPRSIVIRKPSMNDLGVNNLSANHLPQTPHSVQPPPTEPDDEFEGETLADRKRRLAAKDEAENPLPKARPVSGAFSVELLSQFEDPEEKKKQEEEKAKPPGEETLGQRRRRLQAEREAREREMSFNQLSAGPEAGGPGGAPVPGINGRMHQLSNILATHPKREADILAQQERARVERENRLAREREAKLAAYRSQMPQTLTQQMPQSLGGGATNAHNGAFRGGAFNDGTGGQGPQAAMSSPALNTQLLNQPALNHRASAVFSPYGAPMQQQGPYGGSATNLGMMNNNPNMGGYGGMNNLSPYGGGGAVYGGGLMQPGMQPMPGGSMNRIEQWRQSVLP